MGKSVKRLIHLLTLIVLAVSMSVPVGWARQSDEPHVPEMIAWLEEDELRVQIELDDAAKKAELSFSQSGQEKSRTFRDEKRISVAVQLVSSAPLVAELITSSRDETYQWQVSIPEETAVVGEKLAIQVKSWSRSAAREHNLLQVAVRSGATEMDEPDEENFPDNDKEENPDRSRIEKWAEEYYKQFELGEKPKEGQLKALRNFFEMEPNDTFEKADWMYEDKDAFGRIREKGDVDIWKIRATQNGVMNVSLQDIPARMNYSLYVFDEQRRELVSSEKPGQTQYIQGVAVKNREWYYIMVKGAGSSYSKDQYYRLRAEFQSAPTVVNQDPYEHNNSFGNASDIGEQRTIYANLHNVKDLDFYRFSIDLASTIIVKLEGVPAGMDIDIYLMDAKGSTIGKSEKPKNADEEIVVNADPGTYVIKVMASKRSGYAPHTYQLTLSTPAMPVVLIPGIGGTRLLMEERGEVSEIWLGADEIIGGIGDPTHRRALTLTPVRNGSVDVQPLNPGIRVFPEEDDNGFRAIEYLSYDFQGVTEQYYSMVKELESQGYVKGQTLFAMPYDWRYSNATNARYLKERIDQALASSGARQVQLVAHSMGGLLARETLLSNVSYQSKVHRIIYMGTPFLGSPRAYQALKFGYDFGIPLVFHEDTGKQIAEFSPAVYELLPSKKHHSLAPFLMKNSKDKYSYTDFQNQTTLRVPYEPLLNQAIKLHDKWENKTMPNIKQYSIIGTGKSTLMGYRYHSLINRFTPYYDRSEGDGTVPLVSAEYAQKDILKKYYVKGDHAKLPAIKGVIQQVVNLLKGKDSTKAGISKSASKSNDYLYYMLMRDDGEFPVVTIEKAGQEMTIDQGRLEWREDLSVEKHGNLVVIHSLDNQPITFRLPPGEDAEAGLRVLVFSSKFSKKERESGKEYMLGDEGLIEVETLEN
ncbi:lipase/acyltransferase domain-containing protein [Brevibacillus sp. TJ4]|uniref:lipase/acyltransferase domain-containing protein n=1 Tax=Brevibacillus sp. TJ4 TaxID=3234853 RepID=UPI0037D0C460